MPSSLPYLVTVPAFAAVVAIAIREHRLLRASRRGLLDRCADVLGSSEIVHGPDGFPRLIGRWRGRAVHAELIPDTLTIRRLPQLWLSVTWLDPLPSCTGFAALARHTGYEFYGLISQFNHRLEPPNGLPREIVIRGEDDGAQLLLDHMASPLRRIFADPRVKEVAATPKGLRIVRQAGEGRRGEHLLLRQAIFDDAQVAATDLEQALQQLQELRAAVTENKGARAA